MSGPANRGKERSEGSLVRWCTTVWRQRGICWNSLEPERKVILTPRDQSWTERLGAAGGNVGPQRMDERANPQKVQPEGRVGTRQGGTLPTLNQKTWWPVQFRKVCFLPACYTLLCFIPLLLVFTTFVFRSLKPLMSIQGEEGVSRPSLFLVTVTIFI